MKKILLVNNVFPHYRTEIWEKISNTNDYSITYAFGHTNKGIYSKYSEKIGPISFNISNIYLKDILIWQSGVFAILKDNIYDIYIFNGESNVFSTWIFTLYLRLLKKKVIFWGHGLYGNENFFKKWFRIIFNMLPNAHLLYSEYGKSLVAKNFNQNFLFVIKNSINYDISLKLRKVNNFKNYQTGNKINLLFIGRLVKSKKIDLLLKALSYLDLNIYNLIIIGDGPEKIHLNYLITSLSLKNNVIFKDSIYDEVLISEIYHNTHLMVSPGNVGLNIIHSFQYGVPVCTHENQNNQMPEFEALLPFKNGILFRENDYIDLAYKIDIFFKYYFCPILTPYHCFEIVDKYYNPNFQLKIFNKCINEVIS